MARTLPFALFMLVLALRGSFSELKDFSGSFDTRWLYGLQAGLALLAMAFSRHAFGELRSAPKLGSALAICVTLGLLIFLLWIAPMPGWMHLGAPTATFIPVAADGTLLWISVAVRTFGAVLVVPLMEELFWRSFLMRWIDKRDFLSLKPSSVSWFAVLASSTVFALAHELWVAGLVAGLVYAQIYRRLGNLWYSVLAHATTNLALAAWVVNQHAWGFW